MLTRKETDVDMCQELLCGKSGKSWVAPLIVGNSKQPVKALFCRISVRKRLLPMYPSFLKSCLHILTASELSNSKYTQFKIIHDADVRVLLGYQKIICWFLQRLFSFFFLIVFYFLLYISSYENVTLKSKLSIVQCTMSLTSRSRVLTLECCLENNILITTYKH